MAERYDQLTSPRRGAPRFTSPAVSQERQCAARIAQDPRTTEQIASGGFLLCRHHHVLLHNNHWQIVRDDATYRLIPPRDIDAAQEPVRMPTRSPAMRDLEAQRRAAVTAAAGYF